MQLYKRTGSRLSFQLKSAIAFFIFIFICAIFFGLKFSEKKKQPHSDLTFSEWVKPPETKVKGGFYKSPVELELINRDHSTQLYYTTDGSEPTLASKMYTEPIHVENNSDAKNNLSAIPTSPRWLPPLGQVFKGIVIRAIAVDENNYKSKELVISFFIDEKGSKRYSFPVIAITVNEKDFFGQNKGIYVLGKKYTDKDNYIQKNIPLNLPWWDYPSNYLMRGKNAERSCHIEFFETDGTVKFATKAGIRINGNATRGFAQKSLRVCLDKEYGTSQLVCDLFNNNKIQTYSSFILRNSGNDWDKTMFRDAFMQSLMEKSKVDIQAYRPSILFINGEYWGIHNIRERLDEFYISSKYHVPVDSVTIFELGGKLIHGSVNMQHDFMKIIDFVSKNDLSKAENYDYIVSQIEITSFIDFLIANIYFNNGDWPNNNVKMWKCNSFPQTYEKEDEVGRWKWMLYDTDWGFGYNSQSSPESNLLIKAANTGRIGVLFSGLIKNKNFVNVFLNRFQYHLNFTFRTQYVLQRIEQFNKLLEPEIQEHIDRWRVIGSVRKWESNIEVMRDFARRRPQYQCDQLNSFFNLKGEEQILIQK